MSQRDLPGPPGGPFIVLSLPRSRSAWMSHWLSYPGKFVGHDIGIQCNDFQQFISSWKNGMAGTVETGAMIGWRLIKHEIPEIKTLIVLRHPDEVIRSLAAKGLTHGPDMVNEIYSRYHMLNAIAAGKGIQSISWQDLNSPIYREQIFEWLLGIPFDPEWDQRYSGVNIQVDFPARLQQLYARREIITAFKKEVVEKQQLIGLKECPIFN